MKKNTRRTFIRLANASIISLFLGVWHKLTMSHINLTEQNEINLLLNKNKTVSFYEDFIVINRNGKVDVLSSHCTHLGCNINKTEKNQLICPCHGSAYDLHGKPIKGPAFKNLKKIPSVISSDGKTLKIKN